MLRVTTNKTHTTRDDDYVLRATYTERDVRDVESYVRAAVVRVAPEATQEQRERLVRRGIVLVRRIAQALPPDTSLERVLSERLDGAMAVFNAEGPVLGMRQIASQAA
jgi:hypothetical protein